MPASATSHGKWNLHDSQVPHIVGDMHAHGASCTPGVGLGWQVDMQSEVKVGHSPSKSHGEWTLPDGLALPQVGDTHAHAQAHSQVTSQLGTMNNENNNSHHKAQWAGAHALTPDLPRLQVAIENLAKL